MIVNSIHCEESDKCELDGKATQCQEWQDDYNSLSGWKRYCDIGEIHKGFMIWLGIGLSFIT